MNVLPFQIKVLNLTIIGIKHSYEHVTKNVLSINKVLPIKYRFLFQMLKNQLRDKNLRKCSAVLIKDHCMIPQQVGNIFLLPVSYRINEAKIHNMIWFDKTNILCPIFGLTVFGLPNNKNFIRIFLKNGT